MAKEGRPFRISYRRINDAPLHPSHFHSIKPPPLITQVLPISQDTITIRSLDWVRDRFDIKVCGREGELGGR